MSHPDEPAPAEVLDLIKSQAAATLNTYARPPIIFTHGKGLNLYDSQGREYLDLSAGIAVNALGHADEGVQQVLNDQASKLVHCSNLFHNEWSGKLAEAIVKATTEQGGLGFPDPASEPSTSKTSSGLKVFFTSELKR